MSKPVPYLSSETIERDAAALLAEYAQARGIVIAPPIPIEDIVEKHLKLRFEFDDTHKLFGIPRDALPRSAGEGLGSVLRREEPVSGARAFATWPAAGAATPAHTNARLQCHGTVTLFAALDYLEGKLDLAHGTAAHARRMTALLEADRT